MINLKVQHVFVSNCQFTSRMRCTSYYWDWVKRCEETIRSYLTCSTLEYDAIEQLLGKNLRILDQINYDQSDLDDDLPNKVSVESNDIQTVLRQNTLNVKERVVTKKMNSIVMGKIHADMKFLDMLSSLPASERNLSTRGHFRRLSDTDGVHHNPIKGENKV